MKMYNLTFVSVLVISILVCGGVAQSAITDGLVAHWTFDETTGTTASDSCGGFDAAVIGGATFDNQSVPGKFGTALELGSFSANEMVKNADALCRVVTQKITMSVWINPSEYLDTDDPRMDILSWNGAYTSAVRFDFNYNAKIGWQAQDPAIVAGIDSTQTTWNADTWYHIVVTGDINQYKLYVDGVLNASVTGSGSFRYAQAGLTMGNRKEGSVGFSGAIDDVAVWNRALTADEVTYIHNNVVPEPTTLLLVALGSIAALRRKKMSL